MDAAWCADAHRSMWRLAAAPGLCEVRQTARRIAREVAASGAARPTLLSALTQSGLIGMIDRAQAPALSLGLASAELAVADGGAATCLLSAFLPHFAVRDFGTPEQRARYLDRGRYPHAALCLTEPPPGAGVDALALTGRARLVGAPPGAEPWLDVEKRGRFISHMEFADFVLLAVDSGDPRLAGGCVIVAEPGDEGMFDRGLPIRTLGHRLSSVTSPEFRLRVPASRILGGYAVDGDRLAPRIEYRQALDPALQRCRPVVALMTAGKLLATVDAVLAQGLPDLAAALRLVDAWADAEAAASLGLEAARLSDRLDAEVSVTGAAARLFATAHAAQRIAQYAAFPGVLGRLMDAQVEAVYLGAESLQRRQLAASLAAPAFRSQFAQWIEEAGEPGTLRAGLSLLGWTVEFLRRRHLLTDVRQGAGFPLADALCRLLAARALAADMRTLRAAGDRALGFFEDLSVAESAAAASAVAQICTTAVFGYAGPGGPAKKDLRSFCSLRAAVDSSLAGAHRARVRAAAFLMARSIDNRNAYVT
jgi:hypothetical protein